MLCEGLEGIAQRVKVSGLILDAPIVAVGSIYYSYYNEVKRLQIHIEKFAHLPKGFKLYSALLGFKGQIIETKREMLATSYGKCT